MPELRGNTGRIKIATEKRRQRVVELYRQGLNQTEIAKDPEVGVSQVRVSKILSEARRQWAQRTDQDIGEKIMMEIEQLEWVRSAAKDAYEKSQQDAVTVTTKKAPPRKSKDEDSEEDEETAHNLRHRIKKANDELKVIHQEEKRTGQYGDPVMLHVMKDCTIQILKLLNAYPREETHNNVILNQFDFSPFATPIPCDNPIETTSSDEVEARIAAESSPTVLGE